MEGEGNAVWIFNKGRSDIPNFFPNLLLNDQPALLEYYDRLWG